MVAAGIWKRGEIESIKKAIYKKAAMVPQQHRPRTGYKSDEAEARNMANNR